MKQKLKRAAGCILVCLCLVASAFSALAAENPTYVLSFRPGANGAFSDEAEGYLSAFGTVQRSAAGNLFVEVPAGSPFPSGIVAYLQADAGYYYKGGLNGETVNADADYIADYGVLSGSGVLYTVNYVDSVSGASIAESYQGYANPGDTLTFTARTLRGYNVDSASKTLTVSDGAVLNFVYTYDGSNDRTDYVYGEDTVINQTVAQAPTGTADGAGAAGTDTAAPGETIPDADTPLSGGDSAPAGDNTADLPTEDIADNDVPLAQGEADAAASHSSAPVIIGISAGAAALIAILAVVLVKRRSRG